MIDDYVLIGYARKRGHEEDWPEQVGRMKTRIDECILGFPGIGYNSLTLLPFSEINQEKDVWILDLFLESPSRFHDWAPLMFSPTISLLGIPSLKVEGIGAQGDFERDPTRELYRPGMILSQVSLPPDQTSCLVLRVDCRPKKTGGAGYHYFYRSRRDQRP